MFQSGFFSIVIFQIVITGSIASIVQDSVQWNDEDTAELCMFTGNAITYSATNLDRCRMKCMETLDCTHFNWVTKYGGTCSIRKGPISKDKAVRVNERNSICGILTKKHKAIRWSDNGSASRCIFYNRQFKHLRTSNSQLCHQTCTETARCTHYTWRKSFDGSCSLKFGPVSQIDAIPVQDANTHCGIIKVNPVKINWNGQDWAKDCDFPGNNLKNVQVRADNCGPTCLQTPRCTHFSWTLYNGGTCWMKTGTVSKSNAIRSYDYGMICGIANRTSASIIWHADGWAMGCDFPGNNLKNVQMRGEDCGLTCLQTPECTHFSWTSHNGGTCWMKTGTVSKSNAIPSNEAGTVCGIANRTPASIIWHADGWAMGCDFPGNNLKDVQMRGEDCGSACLQTTECTHFSWTTHNGGTCWMKTGTVSQSNAIRSNEPGTVCGIANRPSADIYWHADDWAMACDFPGNDWKSVQVRGQDCGPACLQTAECTHFSWTTHNGGTCRLKTGKISKSNAIRSNEPGMVCGIANRYG